MSATVRHTPTCPECGQPFAVCWASEPPLERRRMPCPWTVQGVKCPGTVVLDVSRDAKTIHWGALIFGDEES